jgi:hypothetical protein
MNEKKKSRTTRYLCVAAQIDSIFREEVFRKILNEEYRFISIPADVDLIVIAKHCLDAKRRKITLNFVISILLILYLYFYTAAVNIYHNHPTLSILSSLTSLLCFLLIFAAYSYEYWFTRYRIIAKYLLEDNFNPDCINLPASTDKIIDKLHQILDEEQSNAVIYSGYSPFIGSGVNIGGWSFTLNINKGKEDIGRVLTPELFTIEELYSQIDSDIKKTHLNQISIEDKIFANGRNIRLNKSFFPDKNPFCRPISKLESSYFDELIRTGGSDTIRHYKCIRIISWKGEIVLSVFLRFVKLNQNLFVEASYFLLPPLKEEYHKIDEITSILTVEKFLALLN